MNKWKPYIIDHGSASLARVNIEANEIVSVLETIALAWGINTAITGEKYRK